MTPVFAKLNLKDQKAVLVVNAPASFESELSALRGVGIERDPSAVGNVVFALSFVTRQSEVDALAKTLTKKLVGDAVVWFAYPKGTSTRYKCDFNRDTGWAVLGKAGFEPVRMVAIDEDWSALRFRRVAFIPAMRRNPDRTLSKDGRALARGKAPSTRKGTGR